LSLLKHLPLYAQINKDTGQDVLSLIASIRSENIYALHLTA